MSTRNISWGPEAVGARSRQPCHHHVLTFQKSGRLNPLETSGPCQACTGITLTLLTSNIKFNVLVTDGNNSSFSYIMCGRSEKYSIKIICCQGLYSTSTNISSMAATYIALSSVQAFKAASFLKALLSRNVYIQCKVQHMSSVPAQAFYCMGMANCIPQRYKCNHGPAHYAENSTNKGLECHMLSWQYN